MDVEDYTWDPYLAQIAIAPEVAASETKLPVPKLRRWICECKLQSICIYVAGKDFCAICTKCGSKFKRQD